MEGGMNGLEILLMELESSRLEVGLVPARRETNIGAMIRVAFSRNCTWYRQFCSRHLSSRFRRNSCVDTKIKRRDVERLLRRLIAGCSSRSMYAAELLALARRRVEVAS
jgi:hypothetical protein